MGSYYKHTKTESIDVPYSFRCEQCMEDSGTLTATISGTPAEINSNFKNLDEGKKQKLSEMAHARLVKAVKEAYQNASEKQIYAKSFRDECPHCHKPQSWAISGVKKGMYSTPFASVVVGIIIGLMFYFFVESDYNLEIALVIVGIGLLVAVCSLVASLVKIANKKRLTSASVQKNEPVIEWSAVQNILDEE